MIRNTFAIGLIVTLCMSNLIASAQTIPEHVRNDLAKGSPSPPFAIPFIRHILDMDLAQMAAQADLILTGSLKVKRTYLSPDETMILTDYAVVPSRIVFRRHEATRPAVGRELTLTVEGGTMSIEGVQVSMVDSNMELPKGRVLLLVLHDRPDGNLAIVGDVQGAFDVSGNHVRHLLKQSSHADEYSTMIPQTLMDRLATGK